MVEETKRKVTGMILSFDDGTSHIMAGPELNATLQWIQNVQAILAAAATIYNQTKGNKDALP